MLLLAGNRRESTPNASLSPLTRLKLDCTNHQKIGKIPLTTTLVPEPPAPSSLPFLGLAPFLRQSIAGTDLGPISQELVALAQQNPEDADQWMNLAIAMFSLHQRDIGLSIQNEALALRRVYHLPAKQQPARCKLLMLLAPGDLSVNTPLECLLEDSDIDLVFYYVAADSLFPAPIPEHDALIVCVGENDDNQPILAALDSALTGWPKPVINRPHHLLQVERAAASELLQNIPGLLMPPTLQIARADLEAVANGTSTLAEKIAGSAFPIILRPLGSHAGHDLERIASPLEIGTYLAQVDAADFFIAPFIDYSGPDGLFRKFRVALIDGQPYACHMAVSSHWMVHYVNAGMYEDAGKRAEELAFMVNFADFAKRHAVALAAIHQRSQLEYLCLDCAETTDGQLLIFEIDHAMVVHAMDSEEMFPYKQQHMLKVKEAFRDFLCRLIPETAR